MILCAFSILLFSNLFAQFDTSKMHYSKATYYHNKFENKKTASGERFSQKKYTAAHRNYKFGTLLLVTDTSTNNWVIVRVNDRCPKRNVLDLSKTAASRLGITQGIGVTRVRVQPLSETFYHFWNCQDSLFNLIDNKVLSSPSVAKLIQNSVSEMNSILPSESQVPIISEKKQSVKPQKKKPIIKSR